MGDHSVEEIDAVLGRAPRPAHRELDLIREPWDKEVTP
jgi:hypothetical protein